MEIVARVSAGSKMDQVYIPKNRAGLRVGSYVLVRALSEENKNENLNFYGLKEIEPIKLVVLDEIFNLIDKRVESYDNLIVTGSFLEKGFNFNDIDILVISSSKIDSEPIEKAIADKLMLKAHLLILSNKDISIGLNSDPLYLMMLSKCLSKKKIIYKISRKFDYKLLDLHLLKSKPLIDNFDFLSGKDKYALTRNLIAISLFIEGKKLSGLLVDSEIRTTFGLKSTNEIKNNLLDKQRFLASYRSVYNTLFRAILEGIKNESKQKQAN